MDRIAANKSAHEERPIGSWNGFAVLAIGVTLVAAYFTPPAGFAISLNTNGLDVIGFFFEGLVVASVIYSLPFMVQPVAAWIA